MTSLDPNVLPDNLPEPQDDGSADHLRGAIVPAIGLKATDGNVINLVQLGSLRTVIFAYPRTCKPGQTMPAGWDEIPGARGCTPQACAFRDLHQSFAELDVRVFGLSTQATDYQREMVQRLQIPYPVLSDEALELTRSLGLPTFEAAGMTLLKRLTLFIRDGRIEHVHFPVFPPDKSAEAALAWLRANPGPEQSS
jgi:peroxiredoxin